MKRLLQSKRFRKNLYKWLMMYASVILMFATVVTYSKYITNLVGEEEVSRITKFDVNVEAICNSISEGTTENENGEEESVDICTTIHENPLENIDYYFKVDTSELEVATLLVLNVKVHPDFEIQSFEEVEKVEEGFKVKESQEGTVVLCQNKGKDNIGNSEESICELSTLTRTIQAAEGTINYYKISVKYNYGDLAESSDSLTKEYKEIVKVGYSATQKE